MDNKFQNLKKEYKEFIYKISDKIKDIQIEDNIDKKKCILIYKLYLEIYNLIEISNDININDINHIINNYSKDNEYINIFKKFIKIKNLYVIKRIIQSNLWEEFINKTYSKLNIINYPMNDHIKYIIEKGIYNLLSKSNNSFRGCWEIASFKDEKIIKLEIIDPCDITFLHSYIIKKIKNEDIIS